MNDKDGIRKNFSAAAGSYDKASMPQKTAAGKMLALIKEHAGCEFPDILELGCGTGHFTKLAAGQLKWETYTVNDLCPAFKGIEGCGHGIHFVAGDAEPLDFDGKYDLICACSVIQWFNDLPAFFRRCAQKTEKGGIVAFSTFCPGNLTEIRQLTGIGLDYHPLSWYAAQLSDSFEILHLGEELVRLNFDSPKTVLRHIKMTGAGMGNGFSFTPSSLKKFETEYRARFASNGRFPLTYNPLYILAKLKR